LLACIAVKLARTPTSYYDVSEDRYICPGGKELSAADEAIIILLTRFWHYFRLRVMSQSRKGLLDKWSANGRF
jgi:hypothetical protein